MKACVLVVEYPPIESGVSIACRRIVKGLSRKHEMHVLTFGSSRDTLYANQARTVKTAEEDGVTVHRIEPYSGTLMNVPPQDVQALCNILLRLHRKEGFDLFHGFNLTGAGHAAVLSSRLAGVKSLVSVRGNDVGLDIFDAGRSPGISWVLENAGMLTFVAEDLLDLADAHTPCRKKSKVVLNALDPFEFFFKDVKLKLDGFVVGFCGVVRQKKGFAYLLEAFRRFSNENGSTLLIIGELMQEEKLTYLKMIDDMKLNNRVMITGRIPHHLVLSYLNLVDVAVFPALSEGCSNAMLEAMYCRKPVISTDVGAAGSIVTNETGVLIEPYSADAIFDALVMMKKSRKRHEMGDAAKERIRRHFNVDKEQKDWLEVYRRCTRS
jgi:L-malate glycosyltransferase